MSDDGERMCPLCAEEMDLTDQQLKPCKCGYEICVWCWHHIVEMAEKDDTEGRCPACRTPYDKERIVGTAANCERVVAEMNSEKRQKSQKPKMKSSAEARKHLSSARVIQRNLVYIIGLPSSLCDENLLEQKEYFGQYGKVLKVSISRPTSSSGQQASNNNTCSVYITYAREEEAVRCIQAVHNFVLEGKSLRACFGTTKYCHAWLRNLTCSNPDCLYLHDVGSQEDSFTKNEIISAYTRSRVPQIASNNLQRRSGSILPPPVDDVCSNGTVSGKHVVKSASNNITSQIKVSANCSTVGKATALPAAASWGLRVSNCRQSAASGACSQSIAKQKVEAVNNLSSIKVSSAWHDDVVTTSKISEGRHTLHSVGRSTPLETSKLCIGRDCLTVVKDVSSETPLDVTHTPKISAWDDDEVTIFKVEESHATHSAGRLQLLEPVGPSIGRTSLSDVSLEPALDAAHTSEFSMDCSTSSLAAAISDKGKGMAMAIGGTHLPNGTGVGGLDRQSSNSDPVNIAHGHADVNGNARDLCVGLSSVNLDNHLEVDHLKVDQHQSSLPNHSFISMMQNRVESPAVLYKAPAMSGSHVLGESHDWNSESQSQGLQSMENNMEDGRVLCVDERQRHSDATSQPSWLSFSCELSGIGNSSSNVSWNNNSGRMSPLLTEGSRSNGVEADKGLLLGGQNKPILSNRHMEDNLTDPSRSVKVSECSYVSYTKEKAKCVEISDSVANINKTASVDAVSDMVLLDFDPWDNSFSAANNLARLLGEAGKQDGSVKQSSLWKPQATNESRFSFARDESQANVLEHSFQDMVHPQNLCSSSQSSFGDGFQNGSFFHNFGYSNVHASSNTFASSDRTPGALKAKISAPPGFSLRNRAPPPGFSSLDRYDQAYGACSDNHLVGSLSLRSQPQMQLTENTTDVEFIDPAILAVGKGRLPHGINDSGFGMTSAFPAHLNSFENDPRFQLLMQQSIPSQQDLRFLDRYGDRLLPLNESHLSSRLLAQNSSNVSSFGQLPLQHTRNGHISSSQWDGWNDVRIGNDVGVAENLRNDRFGLNNYFPGNEEQKFRIPSTGNIYNRAFGL